MHGKGGKVVLVPLPPAVARAVDRAIGERGSGPILRNTTGARMDRRAATRRLKHLAASAGIRMPRMHPHLLRHTFVSTMLDAGVSLRGVQIAARHADPKTTMRYDRARKNLDRHPPLPPRRLHGLQYIAASDGAEPATLPMCGCGEIRRPGWIPGGPGCVRHLHAPRALLHHAGGHERSSATPARTFVRSTSRREANRRSSQPLRCVWQAIELLELINKASMIINTGGTVILAAFGGGMTVAGQGGDLSAVPLPAAPYAAPGA
ncbi:tyrosine-type recombinase/integrase [Couchioplanes azureus]|uniref:tyrosine-type recombinase/integrase n=1 Tax=Couchioplanes caeruleus TaxID=56438 RepID=UPI001E37F19E|nr:tyrosine-type recombinase/integrase [Couchioplanes caeruleus]